MSNHTVKNLLPRVIKNPNSIIAENLFIVLKKEFTDYINYKLEANLRIDYAHVYDTINISFPEVIKGIAFTVVVNDDELNVNNDTKNSSYNTALLEHHLIAFLTEIAG